MARGNFPAHERIQTEGPWDPDPLLADLPRSPKQILALARESQWGFGVISLVFRMNHPTAPPFFLSWHYSTETERWNFAGAMAKNGQKLNLSDVKIVLEHPDALQEEPNV